MIHITNKQDCCGCSACAEICPKQCIFLKEDNEGFLYPQINKSICIDCRLCEKVCPVINQNYEQIPQHVYAAINKDEETRLHSSSGGIFTLLGEQIIDQGGVVFGARFNEKWEVRHGYTETKEGLKAFQGSKYVQSRIEDNFQKTELFLKQNRKVLFSGTPCQIAGLKKYLRKEYSNLLTVDFVCHGVPSPKVWHFYLLEMLNNISPRNKMQTANIEKISFRNKTLGWKKYCFFFKLKLGKHMQEEKTEILEPSNKNVYLKGFLRDIFLRPSCYQCPTKCFKSHSDITLADFWGCNKFYPKFDDDKGVSLVFVHNHKYASYKLQVEQIETTLEKALDQNPAIMKSCRYRKNRERFMKKLGTTDISLLINRYSKRNLNESIRLGIIKILILSGLLPLAKKVLRK